MRWPQWFAIGIMAIEWILFACVHGRVRPDKFDIRVKTVEIGLWAFILWCGGFFR